MIARDRLGIVLAAALALCGCRQDMHDQLKYEPYEASRFFADGRSSRQPVAGTVARGWLHEDDAIYRGLDPNGEYVTRLPIWLEPELLERGRERFEIFCSPCHGRTGDGQGMIVQRGFQQPESFHQARLREVPVGYFFDVMTNGFGQMSSYASQVPVDDRWAIAGYIRALQASRYVDIATLTAEDRKAVADGLRVTPRSEANAETDAEADAAHDGDHAEPAH